MKNEGKLFELLKLDRNKVSEVKKFAETVQIPYQKLKWYDSTGKMPTGKELENILGQTKFSELEFYLRLGVLDFKLENLLAENASEISKILANGILESSIPSQKLIPEFKTELGELYNADCLDLLKELKDDSVDLIFADPPFNLNKFYLSNINDGLSPREYLEWSEKWLVESCRVLKPGGSLFVWNLPKWNIEYGKILNRYLTFRHWIAVDIKLGLPISGRLYPSHYGLLYYTKGDKPTTFKPDRIAMETCRKCYHELKDYGGYKNKMNPAGINIGDVWNDIPPVRHSKYKKRKEANELSVKLLDRIIEMASDEGDTIFDPFGGSGTTYVVAEIKRRKWIGVELGPVNQIVDRFEEIQNDIETLKKYRSTLNTLFPDPIKKARTKRGIWTPETFLNNDPIGKSGSSNQEKLF